jgi:MraZ protein
MPAEAEASKSDSYPGTYNRGVDTSRRVLLPSEWRLAGSAVDFTILRWPMQGPNHLLVLPPKRLDQMIQNLSKASLTNETAATGLRFISALCCRRSLDSYGRLPIPDDLAQVADIKSDAVLAGLFDRFEIWSPERYKANMESDETKKILEALRDLQL